MSATIAQGSPPATLPYVELLRRYDAVLARCSAETLAGLVACEELAALEHELAERAAYADALIAEQQLGTRRRA